MAKKTRTQLSADASNVNILDNTSQQVTPAKVRNQYTDERDSVINYVDDFTGSVGDLLTIGTDGESITWIPVSDVQTPPGGSTGDLQINAGGGNFGATTDIVITSGNVSIPNGNLSVDGNLSLESSLPILSLKDSDTINSAGRIDFKDGTNTVKANIGYNATDGFDFTTTSSFTFDGGDATFSGTVDINASEANTLQVNHSGGTLPTPSAGTVATFAKNNTVGSFAQISVISGVSGSASIEFGDIDDVNIGRVQYDNASNSLKLQSNNAVGLTIDNAQNATFSGNVEIYNTGATSSLTINSDSDKNARIFFDDAGTTIWNIGLNDADNAFNVFNTVSSSNAFKINSDNSSQFFGDATFSGDVSIDTGLNSTKLLVSAVGSNDGTDFPEVQIFSTRNGSFTAVGNVVGRLSFLSNDKSGDLTQQESAIDMVTGNTTGSHMGLSFKVADTDGIKEALYIRGSDQTATFSSNLALSAYGSGSKTGTATYGLGVDASGNVVETSALTAGGAWTPTFSALSTNLTSVICPGGNTAFYQRVGNIVSFSVNVNIAYSSSGSHSFDVSLPISSNFTDSSSVAGVVSSTFNNTNFSGGGVTCDSTDALQVNLQTTGSATTITSIMFSGHYEIK